MTKPLTAAGERPVWAWVNAQALYLFYYMAFAAFMPFISLHYERLGLTGVQIGVLAALPVLINSATGLLWGALADALGWHRRILRLALLLSPAVVIMLSSVQTFAGLLPWVAAYAVFYAPIVPLLDSFALDAARARRRDFGNLRVWGSLGWALGSVGVGALIQRLGIEWLFYSYGILMGLTFLVSLYRPAGHAPLRAAVGQGFRELLGRPGFLLFLGAIFGLAMTMNSANSFYSIYMDAIGASEGLIGLGWALSAASEVPVLLFSGRILRRLGESRVLVIAFLVFIVRWLLFSFITDPVWALLVQLLNGLSFGGFLVGSIAYLHRRAPQGVMATALALFNAVTFGLGFSAGSMLGGVLYDLAGITVLFRAMAVLAAVSLGLFLISERSEKTLNHEDTETGSF